MAEKIYIFIAIVVLFVLFVFQFKLQKNKKRQKSKEFIDFLPILLVVSAIFFENRWIAYPLMGIGITLSIINSYRIKRSKKKNN